MVNRAIGGALYYCCAGEREYRGVEMQVYGVAEVTSVGAWVWRGPSGGVGATGGWGRQHARSTPRLGKRA